jgi:hypothetical protein
MRELTGWVVGVAIIAGGIMGERAAETVIRLAQHW